MIGLHILCHNCPQTIVKETCDTLRKFVKYVEPLCGLANGVMILRWLFMQFATLAVFEV